MTRSRVLLAVIAVCVVIAVIAVVLVAAGSGSDGAGERSTFDDFDERTGSLAGTSTPEGFTWEVPEGQFVVDDGSVRASRGVKSLAVLDLGRVPETIDAEFGGIENGAGIMFRYADPANYWSVVAARDFGTWNILKVVNGAAKFVGNTRVGLSPDGSLEIRLAGPSIRVVVNGQERAAIVDGALQQATGSGLVAADDETGQTEWRSFGLLSR